MAYDADTLIELQYDARLRRQLRFAASARTTQQQMVPKIEMDIGAWHADEFGNQTREIRARD